jgi:tRNA G18 (ribose-2'-O)-methylase SpoU
MVKNKKETYLILHNIRSTYNVGSIFRTADAAGISKIYLTGYTPTPLDRFGRKRGDIAKVALGAEESVSWEYKKNIGDLINSLKRQDVYIVALEQSIKSVDYKKVKILKNTAVIFGNEVKGISKAVLDKCDIVAEIPMSGKKESLNVSVSAGISIFRFLGV